MSAIIPAILVKTRKEIEAQLAFLKGLVETVQIDVVDRKRTGRVSWPYVDGGFSALPEGFDIHDMGDFRFEMDLMVEEPREAMAAFLKAGAGKLIFHAESTSGMAALLDELERDYGRDKELTPDLLSVAIAIHADTKPAQYEPYLDRVDYVQFMGIAREGAQGEPFDERVVDAVKAFRGSHSDILIQVDGGVSLETAPRLLYAGANRLVVGSALWNSGDVPGTLHAFEAVLEEYGQYR